MPHQSPMCVWTTPFPFFYKNPPLLSHTSSFIHSFIHYLILITEYIQHCNKMKMGSASATMGGSKRRMSSSSRGFGGVLREQRARLYIIRRCVVMLLCWHD
nr:uncharacterized protein LOC112779797 [Arachis hypogaea]